MLTTNNKIMNNYDDMCNRLPSATTSLRIRSLLSGFVFINIVVIFLCK